MIKNMDSIIKQFLEALNKEKEKCKQKCNILDNDNRNDEADLEKIKLNIYDIFATLAAVTQNQILKKEKLSEVLKYEMFYNEYLKTFDKIPENWRIKLEKAKENNAVIDIVIEETKLSIALEIKNLFTNLL